MRRDGEAALGAGLAGEAGVRAAACGRRRHGGGEEPRRRWAARAAAGAEEEGAGRVGREGLLRAGRATTVGEPAGNVAPQDWLEGGGGFVRRRYRHVRPRRGEGD